MLLGLSGSHSEVDIELANVTGSDHGDGGVANGQLLTRFAEAVHSGDELDAVRADVVAELGAGALIDAAAICANFNMMVRIADGTGTPLDAGSVSMSEQLRSDLELDQLVSRRVDAS